MKPFKKLAAAAMSLALAAALILPSGVRAEDTKTPLLDIQISVEEGQIKGKSWKLS